MHRDRDTVTTQQTGPAWVSLDRSADRSGVVSQATKTRVRAIQEVQDQPTTKPRKLIFSDRTHNLLIHRNAPHLVEPVPGRTITAVDRLMAGILQDSCNVDPRAATIAHNGSAGDMRQSVMATTGNRLGTIYGADGVGHSEQPN